MSEYTPQQVILKFMEILNNHGYSRLSSADESENHTVSKQMLDEAIRACSPYSGIDDAISKFLSVAQNANGNTDTFLAACGINLSNDDTGAITGSDAGGSTVKNKDDIVPEDTSATFNIANLQTDSDGYLYFTTQGLTVRLIGDASTPITKDNFGSLGETKQKIIAGLYKWWVEQSIILNNDSYNISFKTDGVMVNQIDFYFENNSESNALAYVTNTYSETTGETYKLKLFVNMNYYSSLTDEVNGKSTSDSASYLDRTLAHEFTHAIMGANISYFGNLPLFIKEGMAELTHGIDDTRPDVMKELIGNTETLATYLNLGLTSSTNTSGQYPYAAGYMFLRWLAKTASASESLPLGDLSANVNLENSASGNLYISNNSNAIQDATATEPSNSVKVGAAESSTYTAENIKQNITYNGTWNIKNVGSNFTVQSAAENTVAATVQGNGHHISITAGKGADSIQVVGKYNTIDAGDGDNTIDGGGADNSYNEIITGGGNDSIKYFGSNVTIDTGEGKDTVAAYNDVDNYLISNISINGGTGDDSIIYGAKNSTILGGDGNDYLQQYFSNATENSVDAGAGDDTVIANENYSNIDGGAGNDNIEIYGTGNTVTGGAGNDNIEICGTNNTITGGTGADVFNFYRDVDNITITDLSATDGDVLYFYGRIDTVEQITDGIKVNFESDKAGDAFSINIYLNGTDINSLQHLNVTDIEWTSYLNGSGMKMSYSHTLGDYISGLNDGYQTFNWTTGIYYFEITSDDSNISIQDDAICKTATEANKRYAKVTYGENYNLSISVISTDENNTETADTSYAGIISVDALDYLDAENANILPLKFTKEKNVNYRVSFINALNATLNNLTGADSVATYNYNQEYPMTINGTNYTINGGGAYFIGGIDNDENYISVIYNGEIKLSASSSSSSTYLIKADANGSYVYEHIGYAQGETTTDGVTVLINEGLIAVRGLTDDEMFVYETGEYTYTYSDGYILRELVSYDENTIDNLYTSTMFYENALSTYTAVADEITVGNLEQIDFQQQTSWEGTYYYTIYYYENGESYTDNTPDYIEVKITQGEFTLYDLDTVYTSNTYKIVNANSDGITVTFTPNGNNTVSETLSGFDDGEYIKINDVTYTNTNGKIQRDNDNKFYHGESADFITNASSTDKKLWRSDIYTYTATYDETTKTYTVNQFNGEDLSVSISGIKLADSEQATVTEFVENCFDESDNTFAVTENYLAENDIELSGIIPTNIS